MKIPVNIPVSCPNRENGGTGCTFCSPIGAGFETLDAKLPILEQISRNMEYIGRKYKAECFALYFQNFSNTYMRVEQLERILTQEFPEQIVEIHISTRPDCVSDRTAGVLKKVSEKRPVTVELGLQSPNFRTLQKIERGHTLAEFIDAVLTLRDVKIPVTAHVILDLPWDTREDAVECAKILSALRIQGVKLHSLYIPKGCKMEAQVESGEITLWPSEEYVERAVAFLCYLRKDCVIHRLTGRIPQEFCSQAYTPPKWWEVKERIEERMRESNFVQGCKCDYLDGAALARLA